jgi:hypothetical protein
MPIRYHANYANCSLSYIFWFAPWTTKAHSFFLMSMYMCTYVNTWTCLRRARYYARIICSLVSLSMSPFSSVKINQMMELMSDRLSRIYIYVQNHYIKRKKKTLVAGGTNRQKRVFAFSFFSYKTYAINGMLHWYY